MVWRDKSGFTMIELLIVVILVSLIATIAAPRINLTRYKVEGGMMAVSSTMFGAQRLAVTRQHDVIVLFDVGNQMMYVHEDANNDGARDAGERQRGYPLGEQVVFGLNGAAARPMGASPITFTQTRQGMPAVVFHRVGSASEAKGLYLTSRRANHPEDTRAIEVERSTGRVSWYRFSPPSSWKRGF
jgi:prepilin-type N-terminal cleavage/methylation domain-containing protein